MAAVDAGGGEMPPIIAYLSVWGEAKSVVFQGKLPYTELTSEHESPDFPRATFRFLLFYIHTLTL